MKVTDHEEAHPKFIEATDAIERLQASGQTDADTIFQWLLQAVEYAPVSLKAEIVGIVYRKGQFPTAEHFTPDGKPIFTAEQLAEHFSIPIEDIASGIGLMASQGILVIPPQNKDCPANPVFDGERD
jgi:hypothetical protein